MTNFLGFLLVAPFSTILLILVLAAPVWIILLRPALQGAAQTLHLYHPFDKALNEMKDDIFRVFSALQEAFSSWKYNASSQLISDLLDAKFLTVFYDVSTLAMNGIQVYGEWEREWQPTLAELEEISQKEQIIIMHDFLQWLKEPRVSAVVNAATRRLGLSGEAVPENIVSIRNKILEHSHYLSHGFWYSVYSTIVFQLCIFEIVYVIDGVKHFKLVVIVLTAINIANFVILLKDIIVYFNTYSKQKKYIHEIASKIGIPDLIPTAARILFGQWMAVSFLVVFIYRLSVVLVEYSYISWFHLSLAHAYHFYLTILKKIFT